MRNRATGLTLTSQAVTWHRVISQGANVTSPSARAAHPCRCCESRQGSDRNRVDRQVVRSDHPIHAGRAAVRSASSYKPYINHSALYAASGLKSAAPDPAADHGAVRTHVSPWPDSAGSQLSAIAATDSAAPPSDARDDPTSWRSAQPPTRDRWQRLRVNVIALPRQVDLSAAAASNRPNYPSERSGPHLAAWCRVRCQ
jgi:hypothetical protein